MIALPRGRSRQALRSVDDLGVGALASRPGDAGNDGGARGGGLGDGVLGRLAGFRARLVATGARPWAVRGDEDDQRRGTDA